MQKPGASLKLTIRPESADEFAVIHHLLQTAFQTAYYAEGDEQDFVNRRRNAEEYIPELTLVLQNADSIIGHVMLTRTWIDNATHRRPVLLLAAVCIDSAYRNQGIGTILVKEALQRAKRLGHAAVFVVGDPAFYARFDFRPAIEFGIGNADQIEDQYVLALELIPQALQAVAGIVRLPQ